MIRTLLRLLRVWKQGECADQGRVEAKQLVDVKMKGGKQRVSSRNLRKEGGNVCACSSLGGRRIRDGRAGWKSEQRERMRVVYRRTPSGCLSWRLV